MRDIKIPATFIVEQWDETQDRFWFHLTANTTPFRLNQDKIFINGALQGFLVPADSTVNLVKQLESSGFNQLYNPTLEECNQLCRLF
jgi:hypothetical protein